MKTSSFIHLALLGLAFITFSCKKDKDADPDTFVADNQVAVDGNRADHESEDVSGLEEEIMGNNNISFARTAVVDSSFNYDCATVNIVKKGDNPTGNVTVDFGPGCVGADGRMRKGIIKWTYTNRIKIPGAVITTSFLNYGVKKASGDEYVMIDNSSSKITTNQNSPETSNSISLTRVINMTMHFSDGSSFTHTGSKNIIVSGLNNGRWAKTHTVLAGSVITGTDRKGRAYTQTATTDIVRKGACAQMGIYKPVSGILTITNDNKSKVIDFGNGSCDSEVSVSINGKLKKIKW